ncbi:MAG TPA: DNA replication and repair protein RecF [Deltaproteobacteria bacterium]|nr:DNA replication and repair protein RecF [Deltaproteobacteria bacterium]
MRLRRIVAEGFRNLGPLDLTIPARFIVLHGPNAQGKTNSLEAVHLIATLKPLRGRRTRELIAWGGQAARVSAWIEHEGIERQYRVELTREGRTAKLDGKRVSDLQEYFSGVRAIAFTPEDGRIVSGEPSRRRNWLDRATFTASPAHLDRVRTYRQCLAQKAAALRSGSVDTALLDVLDDQLSALGAELVTRRVWMLSELEPHMLSLHSDIAGGEGVLSLSYSTRARGETVEERRRSLRERLREVRPRELERRTTLAGPQIDNVRISLDDRPARDFASRGQIRSLVLALKLAEMVAARARGEVPLFLIDDASSELDAARTARLVGLLSDLGAQVFATTTDPGPLTAALPREDTLLVSLDGGVLSPGGTPS